MIHATAFKSAAPIEPGNPETEYTTVHRVQMFVGHRPYPITMTTEEACQLLTELRDATFEAMVANHR